MAGAKRSMLVLGGSSMYVLLLLKSMAEGGLLRQFSRITLFGRDRARLAFIAGVGAALADGAKCQVDYATDFARAIEHDYDIVFNQIRFGGLAMRDLDERTAIAAGLAADETLGIVGVSNAIRTIDGMAPYVAALAARTHRPRWINFTNPCSIVTQHLVDSLGPQAIGICDYPNVFKARIAAFLGVPEATLRIDYFGLNHFAFVHGIESEGRQLLPQLLADSARFELAIAAQRHLDYLVVPSWDMVFDPEPLRARQRAQRNRAATLLEIEQECQRRLDAGATDPALYFALLAQRDCAWYELAVTPLLAICCADTPREAIVNLPMEDLFGLGRAHCVVETNALVDARGARALALPGAVRDSLLFDYCRSMKRAELELLDGIGARDPDAVIRSCLANPMIRSSARIAIYFERLRAADPAIAQFFQAPR
jgi:6-phospho-beta-glucosidase